MVMIGEWSDEKKAYVLYNVVNTNFGRNYLKTVMLHIVNNDTDVCVCTTCMLKGYRDIGHDVGVDVVKHWANEYDLVDNS